MKSLATYIEESRVTDAIKDKVTDIKQNLSRTFSGEKDNGKKRASESAYIIFYGKVNPNKLKMGNKRTLSQKLDGAPSKEEAKKIADTFINKKRLIHQTYAIEICSADELDKILYRRYSFELADYSKNKSLI